MFALAHDEQEAREIILTKNSEDEFIKTFESELKAQTPQIFDAAVGFLYIRRNIT